MPPGTTPHIPYSTPSPTLQVSRSSALPTPRDVPTFSVVDAVTPVGTAPCAACRGAIVDTYYETDQGVICVPCQARMTAPGQPRTSEGQFGRALTFGVLAAIATAAGYIALLATTGRELTATLFLIGLVVGKAVRTGARGRGGRRFQWLAVALTYLAIATTYVPFVVKGYSRSSSPAASSSPATDAAPSLNADAEFLMISTAASAEAAPAKSLPGAALGLGALLLLAAAAPVLESATHVVGTLIMLAALFQAWRMNRRVDLTITGPYRVRAPRA